MPVAGISGRENGYGSETTQNVQAWFEKHVTLDGKPYTLDHDQANAVLAMNSNTLVVARAGSGKTRVIVAKIVYLIARRGYSTEEILVFMFNRTAAAEVNQRIMNVEIDGERLLKKPTKIASTFHKFALDTVKSCGKRPEIISERQRESYLETALEEALRKLHYRPSSRERQELHKITSSFVNRASQKYPGTKGSQALTQKITEYCNIHSSDPVYHQKVLWHKISLETYRNYYGNLKSPSFDFNILMTHATELLISTDKARTTCSSEIVRHIQKVRFIMIDEYQDFSYLFFSLTQATRQLTNHAKLFVVGDDWQAINRFAGSDVDYFNNFKQYFSENTRIIPLSTNYRSDRRIVERANQFMLREYDPAALPAKAFSKKHGKIHTISPEKIRFQADDLTEDSLGDGRYLALTGSIPAAKLLKLVTRIIRHHRNSDIMLLHRHNYTSFEGIDLLKFMSMLQKILVAEHIINVDEFKAQVRSLTMHRSKGLEADVVILLELDQKIVRASHPHATIFELFDDTLAAETADQQRLLYVAMTRARHHLYLLSNDKNPPV